jgi:hypothetical protein
MKEEYAYGYWEVEGKSCPIKSAGLKDRDFAAELADSFDGEIAEDRGLEEDQGTIDSQKAAEAFIRIRERAKAAMGREPERAVYYEHIYELCEEVIENEFEAN